MMVGRAFGRKVLPLVLNHLLKKKKEPWIQGAREVHHSDKGSLST
jgi:hypothetical protein